jgi:hypothetical protein
VKRKGKLVKEGRRGQEGERQTGRCSVRMERSVSVSVASKNSIWVLALKAGELSGFNLFCQIAWRTYSNDFGSDIPTAGSGCSSIGV